MVSFVAAGVESTAALTSVNVGNGGYKGNRLFFEWADGAECPYQNNAVIGQNPREPRADWTVSLKPRPLHNVIGRM